MIFPISVNFNRKLKTTITPDNKQRILLYIKNSISEDKADNIILGDMSIRYKGSTSRWNGSLFRGVDNGIFHLFYKDKSWFLNYQINMSKLFIWTSIIATFMGVYMQKSGEALLIGIGAFGWLCGGNWVIHVIRHSRVASDTAFGIDELFADKELIAESDEDKERLKSWF